MNTTLIAAAQADESLAWPEAIIASVAVASFLIGFVVVIWQLLATYRARMSITRENAYQALAERTTASQERIAADLAELRVKVSTMERLMKEVE